MRYYIDLEFLENGKTIEVISLACVAEDGRELYAENEKFNWDNPDEDLTWLTENVKPHLWHKQKDLREFNLWSRDGGVGGLMTTGDMARELVLFTQNDGVKPEFWGYYCDYDWVAICQLYGRMIDLPKGFPMYCRDLKQEADRLGVRFPQQTATDHHALNDARWIKAMHESIIKPSEAGE